MLNRGMAKTGWMIRMANVAVSDKTHDAIADKAHDAHMTMKTYAEKMHAFICAHEDDFKEEMF